MKYVACEIAYHVMDACFNFLDLAQHFELFQEHHYHGAMVAQTVLIFI